MMKRILLGLCLGVACASPAAHATDSDLDAAIIMPSEVPADAPRFENYAAGPVYRGPIANPDVKGQARSRLYRTVISGAVREGVNFAGHYTMATWGCGSGCASHAIIDVRTGRVFHPVELRNVDHSFIDSGLLDGKDGLPFAFRPDSRLLVIVGGVDEKRHGIFYYEWRGERLRPLRYVAHKMPEQGGK